MFSSFFFDWFHLSVQRRCLFSYTLCKEKNEVERGREPQFNFNIYWASKCIAMKALWRTQNWVNTNLAEDIKWKAVKKSKRLPNRGQVELSHLPSRCLRASQAPSGSLLLKSVREPVSPPSTLNTMLRGSHSIIRSCSKTMYGCDQRQLASSSSSQRYVLSFPVVI